MGAVTRGEGYNHVHVVTQNKEKAEAEKFKGAEERKNKRQAKQVNLIAVGAASTLQDRLQGLCGDGGWTPENLCKKFKADELKALIAVKAAVPKGVKKSDFASQLSSLLSSAAPPLLLTNHE